LRYAMGQIKFFNIKNVHALLMFLLIKKKLIMNSKYYACCMISFVNIDTVIY
jgi:hypothetical protein